MSKWLILSCTINKCQRYCFCLHLPDSGPEHFHCTVLLGESEKNVVSRAAGQFVNLHRSPLSTLNALCYQQYKDMLNFSLNFTIPCTIRKFRMDFMNIITAYCLRILCTLKDWAGRPWRQRADWAQELNTLHVFTGDSWSEVDPFKLMSKCHFPFRFRFDMHFLNANCMQNIIAHIWKFVTQRREGSILPWNVKFEI